MSVFEGPDLLYGFQFSMTDSSYMRYHYAREKIIGLYCCVVTADYKSVQPAVR